MLCFGSYFTLFNVLRDWTSWSKKRALNFVPGFNKSQGSFSVTFCKLKQGRVSKIQIKTPMHLADVTIPTVPIKVRHVCGTNSSTVRACFCYILNVIVKVIRVTVALCERSSTRRLSLQWHVVHAMALQQLLRHKL